MRSAIRITFLYLLFAGLWIVFSDRILGALTTDARELTTLQTFKGWFFVATSGLLLFLFISRELRTREKTEYDRRAVEEEIQFQLEKSRGLHQSAQAFTRTLQFDELTQDIVRRCVESFHARAAWLCHRSSDGRVRILTTFPNPLPFADLVCADCHPGQKPHKLVCSRTRNLESLVIDNLEQTRDPLPWKQAACQSGIRSVAFFPLHSHEDAPGTLMVAGAEPGFFTVERVDFFQAYAHQAAIALESAALYTEKATRVERLKALRRIDTAIASSFDLKKVLRVVLEQTLSQLQVDAANVLLLNREQNVLEFVEGLGFRTNAIEWASVGFDGDWAGRAAREQTLVLRSFDDNPTPCPLAVMARQEGFRAYLALPLVAKDKVEGVLEVFHRSPLEPEAEWIDFLQTLAGQAAIAIENALLFNNLELTNSELTRAYDCTLEGWSHALELRDIETHGHTQRVMEATLLLARTFGMAEDDLMHVRRGALLHDIGKLAIPDRILLKAGPLTDSEWEIMSLHPLYAYELLSPIPFLRPSIDIPFCHHEWWDGTGYPRGLKGTDIPLAARVFAVIDVVDALCSNRPYCERWPKEKVLNYIHEQSGKQFDPDIVRVFFEKAAEVFSVLEATTPSPAGLRRDWRRIVFDNLESTGGRVREDRTPMPVSRESTTDFLQAQ